MSGSHSPFSVQVDELGPVSASPGGQLNLTVLPSIGKTSSESSTLGIESFVDNTCNSGCPQLTRKTKLLCDCLARFPQFSIMYEAGQ